MCRRRILNALIKFLLALRRFISAFILRTKMQKKKENYKEYQRRFSSVLHYKVSLIKTGLFSMQIAIRNSLADVSRFGSVIFLFVFFFHSVEIVWCIKIQNILFMLYIFSKMQISSSFCFSAKQSN